jgi:lipoyl(octanoyl) transferase
MSEDGHLPPEIWCLRRGVVPYPDALGEQKDLERYRQAGRVPDVLLLLEHPPVYTRGRRSEPGELPMGEEWYRAQGIDVVQTDRGGRITYHGPGQLVGYPIMSLKPYRDDVAQYIRRMESAIIASLADVGIEAGPIEGLTGVWTHEPRKIASIGVHVSRGVTTHGFAINVNNDLQPFEWIVPCGIDNCRMTSVSRELGAQFDMSRFMDIVEREVGVAYGRLPRHMEELIVAAEAA